MVISQGGEGTPRPAPGTQAPGLVLFVVDASPSPLAAVIGSEGTAPIAAVAIPAGLPITIPGQGDGEVGDVITLPGRSGTIAVANLLGVWVDHLARMDLGHLSAVVDRAGGIDVGGSSETGAELTASLSQGGSGRELLWGKVLAGLLAGGPTWERGDFLEVDSLPDVVTLLEKAGEMTVVALPTRVSAGGIEEPDYDAIADVVVSVLGAPARVVVPVIVLNGSGEPGVGEAVASAIVPGGFRVVVSGNASSFDHAETLIVVGDREDRPLADRVRDLLGVGHVAVSGPSSGIGDVTVIVGKDFGSG